MDNSSFGYAGNILRINLSNGTVKSLPLGNLIDWIGGQGAGVKILYDEVKPWVTPYDPANRLVLSSGALNGLTIPCGGRFAAHSKSPVTLGVGSSNAGGHFGAELKYAGYDHIVVEGKSDLPVYVWIQDHCVEIRNAASLWGKSTWETDALLRRTHGSDIQIMAIGVAGEKLVRGASIMINKHRALGRCGLGAVMGSKGLKAIAVRGSGALRAADPAMLFASADRLLTALSKSKVIERFGKYGSIAAVASKYVHGGFPYKNFQDLHIPEDMREKFEPAGIIEKYRIGRTACHSCPIACQNVYRIPDGDFSGIRMEGTQFESLANFGSKLGIDDFSFCIAATAMCNQWGLDIDPAAQVVAWVMECYEKGLLKPNDLDGLKPAWGDKLSALEIIRKMAFREGIGDILSEGVAKAASIIGRGTDRYAMHVKGQDLYEPLRYSIGWALGTCVSTRGGGHTTGAPVCETNTVIDHEIAERKYGIDNYNKPLDYEGKPELVIYYEMLNRLSNSLGLCLYATDWHDAVLPGFEEVRDMYAAATGINVSVSDLKKASLRMLNLERAFNYIHAGFSRKDDYPPRRDLEEAVVSGPIQGFKLDRQKWDIMLDRYYDLHGWDRRTGLPASDILNELGLETVAADLRKVSCYECC